MTSLYRNFGKRVFDLVVSVPLLLLLSPLLVAVAVLVRLFLGYPVLFRQERPGFRGKIFTLHKFRTMTDARDATGKLLPDEHRLTAFGRWLRKLSLDELPQLWNVVRGDMSLVGPRPLLPRYLPRYTPEQARRHEVRPGITGWAQVNGRNVITWEEKFQFDVWYVDHYSLSRDLKILFFTFAQLFRPSGTSAANHATMPEFMGTTTGSPISSINGDLEQVRSCGSRAVRSNG